MLIIIEVYLFFLLLHGSAASWNKHIVRRVSMIKFYATWCYMVPKPMGFFEVSHADLDVLIVFGVTIFQWRTHAAVIDKLDCYLIDTFRNSVSLFQLEELVALLILTFSKLENEEKLVDRIILHSSSNNKFNFKTFLSLKYFFRTFCYLGSICQDKKLVVSSVTMVFLCRLILKKFHIGCLLVKGIPSKIHVTWKQTLWVSWVLSLIECGPEKFWNNFNQIGVQCEFLFFHNKFHNKIFVFQGKNLVIKLKTFFQTESKSRGYRHLSHFGCLQTSNSSCRNLKNRLPAPCSKCQIRFWKKNIWTEKNR